MNTIELSDNRRNNSENIRDDAQMENLHNMRLLLCLLERFPNGISIQKLESILSVKLEPPLKLVSNEDIGVDYEMVNGQIHIRYSPPLYKEVDTKEWN